MERRLPTYRPGGKIFTISGAGLKWVGLLLACLSSFSIAMLQRGMLRLGNGASLEELAQAMKPGGDAMGWASGAVLCSLAATLAIPIYAKLLCEGWLHTSSKKQYLMRLAGCALLSEPFYDFAMNGQWMDRSVQNPVWALLLAAVMLEILHRWAFQGKAARLAFRALVVLAAAAWTLLLRVYMGPMLVFLCALFYFAGKKGWIAMLGGTLLTLFQFPAPLGLLFVHWYDGSKGDAPRRLFYALYPAQLLFFGVLGMLI